MSSLKWPKTQQKGGIFIADQDVSPFAAANKAFVPYCSSDAFLGNSAATDNHLGLHFRGQALVEGSIRTLVSEHGLGPGHTLVFGGCSAGGRGAMFTLDYLPAMLPTGVTLLGLFDAVLWIDGFDSRMLHQTKTILELTNATARLGTKCLEVYGSTSERWKCMFGQHRVGLVEQPFLVSTSQYDTFQLVTKLGHPPPWTDAQIEAVSGFRHQVQSTLSALDANKAAFSVACYQHCLTETDTFWLRTATNSDGLQLSLAEMIRRYLALKSFRSKKVIEGCQGSRFEKAPKEPATHKTPYACGCADIWIPPV